MVWKEVMTLRKMITRQLALSSLKTSSEKLSRNCFRHVVLPELSSAGQSSRLRCNIGYRVTYDSCPKLKNSVYILTKDSL